MALTNKKISVVVTCYNEAGNIQAMYDRLTAVLSKVTPYFEIIYTDNASTDNSEEIFRKLAAGDPRVKVIFFSRNFGSSQFGLAAGTREAKGDAVVWIDGDQQDQPELILEFAKKWLDGYQVVYGVRIGRRGGSFMRRLAYKAFYRVFRHMAYVEVPVDAGDFCLIDRKVVDVLNAMPERDRYHRGLRAWAGFRSTGVPYVRDDRFAGESSESWTKNIWWAKKAVFSFSYRPLEWLSYIALFVIGLTFLGVLWQLFAFFVLHATPGGFISIILLVFFLGGIQLFSLAVIGEYVGRIFEEVKQRPLYIIKEFLNEEKKGNGAPKNPHERLSFAQQGEMGSGTVD
ncbi:MAG: hypothetical protein A3D65_03215 [Candidatus Lloydbacteria bacterium RIFCSPHIGHO2_02_FULL_50_13]|uniref:Glycosyltransferase 2-like domain-containing protein n=1 Tax=Candidatus Lloydbacteria bacterium RIFCSPHIGHO2_02_FULL_50_13 TaxID=1798661 RepID=A0A1G2D5P2_9BACT|nr:MAG: hypothetical protein A3D65_03215 [Candidatus Lloydbacteria bacterium RIFCSPHIGHO2_02_FULL_50_13]